MTFCRSISSATTAEGWPVSKTAVVSVGDLGHKAAMSLATLALLGLVFSLLLHDWSTLRGKNRRALLLEVAVFVAGAFFIAFPERATALAHFVGIGRGVDFLMYPIVIWLVRESLLTRRRRLEDGEKITQLARALAMAQARTFEAPKAA